MRLFDPVIGATREVAPENLFTEIFDKHCRLPPRTKDDKKLAHYIWKWISRDLTSCLRPSFAPWLSHLAPYYKASELHNLAKNLRIPSLRCEDAASYEFSIHELSEHFEHVLNRKQASFVHGYSLFDAAQINAALRTGKGRGDPVLERKIHAMLDIVQSAPPLRQTRTVFRFVDDDSYIGDTTDSFWSCTRNPFYDPVKHPFGYIVLAIELPANEAGIALCMEGLSLFPQEQEILLRPGLRFRVLSVEEKSGFWHYDLKAQKLICRYIRIRVEPGSPPFTPPAHELQPIREVGDLWELEDIPEAGAVRAANLHGLLYATQYVSQGSYYSAFFADKTDAGLAVVQWDPDTGETLNFIEVVKAKGRLEANYLSKYFPTDQRRDEDLLQILMWLGAAVKSITAVRVYPHHGRSSRLGAINQDLVRLTHSTKNKRRFSDVPEVTVPGGLHVIRTTLLKPVQADRLPDSLLYYCAGNKKMQCIELYTSLCATRPDLAHQLLESLGIQLVFHVDLDSLIFRVRSVFVSRPWQTEQCTLSSVPP